MSFKNLSFHIFVVAPLPASPVVVLEVVHVVVRVETYIDLLREVEVVPAHLLILLERPLQVMVMGMGREYNVE